MPITITPAPTFNGVGPGLWIDVASDFVGPLPTGTVWTTQILPVGTENNILTQHTVWTNNHQRIKLWDPNDSISQFPAAFVAEGTTVTVAVQLQEPGFVIDDTGSTTAPFSSTNGLSTFMQDWANKGNVTLNPTQSEQLTNIDNRTEGVLGNDAPTITDAEGAHAFTLGELFSGKALDQITLTEVTTGPQSTPATSVVGFWLFGVIVRITTVPPSAVPITPDANYYPFDLAVLRVFRGTDQEERFGIHNTSFLHTFHNLYGGVVLNETLLFGNPPAMSIEVDFALGVSGQVFLMRFP